ncbi:MAG TPA: hypothetical protein VGA13_01210 [Acidimicrobiales bacterium]
MGEPIVRDPTGDAPTTSAARRVSATAAFFGVCIAGIIVAVLLAAAEAGREPDLELSDVAEVQQGLLSEVSVEVTNNSDDERCPQIHIAARDRSARDLAEAPADPATGQARLAPGASATYTALVELTEQERREELDEFDAYVADDPPCR